jgi:hypothetical protein
MRYSKPLVALIVFAIGAFGIHCAGAAANRGADQPDAENSAKVERIAVPIVSVQWPVQTSNSLIRHAMEQASNAARLCATQVAAMSCEMRKARRVGRTTALLTGIFGAVTAAGVSSAQLVNEASRDDYTTVWAVSGGLATAIMGAVTAYGNADQRGQQASERIGAIEQAAEQFLENWNATLVKHPPQLEDDKKTCKHHLDGDNLGIVYTRIDNGETGLLWTRSQRGVIALGERRCGLAPVEQLALDRELSGLVAKLMLTCGSSTQLASSNCEFEAREAAGVISSSAATDDTPASPNPASKATPQGSTESAAPTSQSDGPVPPSEAAPESRAQ